MDNDKMSERIKLIYLWMASDRTKETKRQACMELLQPTLIPDVWHMLGMKITCEKK